MQTTSLASLSEHVQRMTAQNSDPKQPGRQPPKFAAQDPFLEPLIDSYASRLPVPIRDRLLANTHDDDVSGWLAAGAIYELLSAEPSVRSEFLRELDCGVSGPGRAAMAFAKAYSLRHIPPVKSARWTALDRLGLALQLVAAFAICLSRGLVFCFLASWLGCLSTVWEWKDVLLSVLALPLLDGSPAPAILSSSLLAAAVVWMSFEAICGLRALESIRRLPAISHSEPPPISWRADAFTWAWWLFATVLGVVLSVRTVGHLISMWRLEANVGLAIETIAVVIVVLLAQCWVIAAARANLNSAQTAVGQH